MRRTTCGHRVGRVEALVRVGLPGQVGVGGDLPAGQVDRLEPGPDLLHRLVAGQRAERVHVVLGVQQVPQPLGAQPGQRVLLLHRAAQPDHVLGGVGALDAAQRGFVVPLARCSRGSLLGVRLAALVVPLLPCRVRGALEAMIVHWILQRHVVPWVGIRVHKLAGARTDHRASDAREELSNFHLDRTYGSSFSKKNPTSLTSSGLDLATFGQRLRHLRRARGLTLAELGERVGRAPSALSLLENGRREPKLSLIESLAKALSVPPEELLRPQPPSRRAQLEIALEEAQRDPLYARPRPAAT